MGLMGSVQNGTYLSRNYRHPGACRDPVATANGYVLWIPACAGMTVEVFSYSDSA